MTRWWTKPPIIVAALGVLAVLITALLTWTTITQQTSGAGSPAIGSAGGNMTITQQHDLQPAATQTPATSPAATLQGQTWWQQPPVIAGMITAIATLVAALIQRARVASPSATKTQRLRRKS
jgi:hypothetical protein